MKDAPDDFVPIENFYLFTEIFRLTFVLTCDALGKIFGILITLYRSNITAYGIFL